MGYSIRKNDQGKYVVVKETPEEKKQRMYRSTHSMPAFITVLESAVAGIKPLRDYAASETPQLEGVAKYVPPLQGGRIVELALKRMLSGSIANTDKLAAINEKVARGELLTDEEARLARMSHLNPILDIATGIKDVNDMGNTAAINKIRKTTEYQGPQKITSEALEDLKGKTIVSKQYISDLTNRPGMKQSEKNIIRRLLKEEGDKVDVSKFAEKIEDEFIPLKTVGGEANMPSYEEVRRLQRKAQISGKPEDWAAAEHAESVIENATLRGGAKYESITLRPSERGNVKNYFEHIYESPVKTTAGDIHYRGLTDNYYGHVRIEDMADNQTRRLIEIQTDLYQKGNLQEHVGINDLEEQISAIKSGRKADIGNLSELEKRLVDIRATKPSMLEQYNNPTAHERMVREEIKKAAIDGKDKIQIPTGETAMKIEGLDKVMDWYDPRLGKNIQYDELRVGQTLNSGEVLGEPGSYNNMWYVTDKLGDGKFKAVPEFVWNNTRPEGMEIIKDTTTGGEDIFLVKNNNTGEVLRPSGEKTLKRAQEFIDEWAGKSIDKYKEEFNMDPKVDTSNPIYRFYEKVLGKYLQKRHGAKYTKDPQGVTWWEINVDPKQGKMPVEAFSFPIAIGGYIITRGKNGYVVKRKKEEQPL